MPYSCRLTSVLVIALLFFGAPSVLRADDRVRSAQESLKSLGFYSGPVDGEPSADFKGAIRRYQIRNGLESTGELDRETETALKQGEAGNVAPETPPTESEPANPQPNLSVAPVAPSVRNSPAPEPPTTGVPPAVSVPGDRTGGRLKPFYPPGEEAAPVRPGPSAESDPAFAQVFARTPYATAPAVVQRDTLRKAQSMLARHGLFDARADGTPGVATEEALLRYQSASGLPRTGRLDIDTLAKLHLLPVTRLPLHRRPGHGDELRVPPSYPGAVRGVPVD